MVQSHRARILNLDKILDFFNSRDAEHVAEIDADKILLKEAYESQIASDQATWESALKEKLRLSDVVKELTSKLVESSALLRASESSNESSITKIEDANSDNAMLKIVASTLVHTLF